MSLVLAFLNAFMNTALMGVFVRLGITWWFDYPGARLPAFCIAIGFAIGRYGGRAEFGTEAAALFSGAAGALFALLALWMWWFKRNGATDEA